MDFRGSTSAVWVNCPSALNFSKEPDKDRAESLRNRDIVQRTITGDLFHYLIPLIFYNRDLSVSLLDKDLVTHDGKVFESSEGWDIKNEGTKSSPIKIATKGGVDAVWETFNEGMKNDILTVIEFLDVKKTQGYELCFESFVFYRGNKIGTTDCLLFKPGEKTIVLDFKYGWSKVNVRRLPQLMTYAACLGLTEAVLMVFQPNIRQYPETYEASAEELDAWRRKIIWAEECAAQGGLLYLRAGEHCSRCDNSHKCPMLYATARNMASYDKELDLEEAAYFLPSLKAIKKCEEKISKRITDALKSGAKIPGYDLCGGRRTREYIEQDNKVLAERLGDFARKNGIDDADILTTEIVEKIVSPSEFSARIKGEGSGAKKELFTNTFAPYTEGAKVLTRVYEPEDRDFPEDIFK